MTRNNSIDVFRLFASFAVILLHVKYGNLPLAAVNHIRLLGRFGVPFFFLLSGFFFYQGYKKTGDGAFNKTLQRVIGVFLVGSLTYAVLRFDTISFSYLLLFEGSNIHLWFLSSMVFGLIVCWYNHSYVQSKSTMFLISTIIIVLSLVSDAYSFVIPFKMDAGLSRYLLSVPYIFFGMYVAERNIRLTKRISLLLIVVGVLLQAGESVYLYEVHGRNPFELQFLIGTAPFAIGIFFLSFDSFSNEVIAELGRKYSLPIYIYHPLVNFFLFTAVKKTFSNLSGIIFMISPLISFGVTLLVLMAINRFVPAIFSVLNGDLKKLSVPNMEKQLVGA